MNVSHLYPSSAALSPPSPRSSAAAHSPQPPPMRSSLQSATEDGSTIFLLPVLSDDSGQYVLWSEITKVIPGAFRAMIHGCLVLFRRDMRRQQELAHPLSIAYHPEGVIHILPQDMSWSRLYKLRDVQFQELHRSEARLRLQAASLSSNSQENNPAQVQWQQLKTILATMGQSQKRITKALEAERLFMARIRGSKILKQAYKDISLYPRPRLFIALPEDDEPLLLPPMSTFTNNSSNGDNNHSTNNIHHNTNSNQSQETMRFRLHYLCESGIWQRLSSGRGTSPSNYGDNHNSNTSLNSVGSNTSGSNNNNVLGNTDQLYHVHIMKHNTQTIHQPKEFFAVFGDYILSLLLCVKHDIQQSRESHLDDIPLASDLLNINRMIAYLDHLNEAKLGDPWSGLDSWSQDKILQLEPWHFDAISKMTKPCVDHVFPGTDRDVYRERDAVTENLIWVCTSHLQSQDNSRSLGITLSSQPLVLMLNPPREFNSADAFARFCSSLAMSMSDSLEELRIFFEFEYQYKDSLMLEQVLETRERNQPSPQQRQQQISGSKGKGHGQFTTFRISSNSIARLATLTAQPSGMGAAPFKVSSSGQAKNDPFLRILTKVPSIKTFVMRDMPDFLQHISAPPLQHQIGTMPNLTTLVLDTLFVANQHQAMMLTRILVSCPNLTHVHFDTVNCMFEGAAIMDAIASRKQLTTLKLVACQFDLDVLGPLSQIMTGSIHLKELVLDGNSIGSATHVAKVLSKYIPHSVHYLDGMLLDKFDQVFTSPLASARSKALKYRSLRLCSKLVLIDKGISKLPPIHLNSWKDLVSTNASSSSASGTGGSGPDSLVIGSPKSQNGPSPGPHHSTVYSEPVDMPSHSPTISGATGTPVRKALSNGSTLSAPSIRHQQHRHNHSSQHEQHHQTMQHHQLQQAHSQSSSPSPLIPSVPPVPIPFHSRPNVAGEARVSPIVSPPVAAMTLPVNTRSRSKSLLPSLPVPEADLDAKEEASTYFSHGTGSTASTSKMIRPRAGSSVSLANSFQNLSVSPMVPNVPVPPITYPQHLYVQSPSSPAQYQQQPQYQHQPQQQQQQQHYQLSPHQLQIQLQQAQHIQQGQHYQYQQQQLQQHQNVFQPRSAFSPSDRHVSSFNIATSGELSRQSTVSSTSSTSSFSSTAVHTLSFPPPSPTQYLFQMQQQQQQQQQQYSNSHQSSPSPQYLSSRFPPSPDPSASEFHAPRSPHSPHSPHHSVQPPQQQQQQSVERDRSPYSSNRSISTVASSSSLSFAHLSVTSSSSVPNSSIISSTTHSGLVSSPRSMNSPSVISLSTASHSSGSMPTATSATTSSNSYSVFSASSSASTSASSVPTFTSGAKNTRIKGPIKLSLNDLSFVDDRAFAGLMDHLDCSNLEYLSVSRSGFGDLAAKALLIAIRGNESGSGGGTSGAVQQTTAVGANVRLIRLSQSKVTQRGIDLLVHGGIPREFIDF